MERQVTNEGLLLADAHELPDTAQARISEMLSSIERSLNELAQGLTLVGLKRCCWCSKFFKNTQRDALFDGGELVCFSCIPAWWAQRREQLSLETRRDAESKLVFWLRSHRQARVVKQSPELGENPERAARLVVTCLQCRGSGALLGDRRCRYCDALGKVWVIVPGWTTDSALSLPVAGDTDSPVTAN